MGRLFPLLILVNVALLVIALIDCLSSDEEDVRTLPKIVWVFVILLSAPIGPIAWLAGGRPRRQTARSNTWRPGGRRPGGRRPEATQPRALAPDDDPEFLRNLAKQRTEDVRQREENARQRKADAEQRKEDEELLRQWEADLRRREDEQRSRDSGDDSDPA